MTSALHHIPHRTKKLPPLRVGIGGPVGSGKTTLLEMLCKAMRDKYDLVAITNDIYTKEDQRLLTVAARCRPNASWAWRPAAARTPRSAKTPRSTSKPSTACWRDFPDADVVFVESRRRQPGRHLQPRAVAT